MKQRVLTSIGIGIVVIPIMILSKYIVYPIFLGLLSAIAVWELLRVFGFDKRLEICVPAYVLAGLLPVFAHSYFTKGDQTGYLLLTGIVVFSFLLYLAMVCVIGKEIVMRRNEEKTLPPPAALTIIPHSTEITSSTSESLPRRKINTGAPLAQERLGVCAELHCSKDNFTALLSQPRSPGLLPGGICRAYARLRESADDKIS